MSKKRPAEFMQARAELAANLQLLELLESKALHQNLHLFKNKGFIEEARKVLREAVDDSLGQFIHAARLHELGFGSTAELAKFAKAVDDELARRNVAKKRQAASTKR